MTIVDAATSTIHVNGAVDVRDEARTTPKLHTSSGTASKLSYICNCPFSTVRRMKLGQ